MLRKLSFLFLFVSANLIFASSPEHSEEHNDAHNTNKSEEFDPVPVIMHHISDAHDWHFWDTEDENGHVHSVSIPLPIILYTDKGLVSFMSSEFNHDDEGKVVVEKNGQKFVKAHGAIYYASETENHGSFVNHVTENGEELITNAKPWDFSLTKNVIGIFLAMIIILLVFTKVARSYKTNGGVPKGLTGWMEPLVVFVRDDIAKANISEHKYKKFVPLLLTIFFFVWVLNLLGLIPGGANVTGNIAVTLVLATVTMLVVALNGNKEYWMHILWPPVPHWLKPLMIPVEIIGIFTKPFALMIRLFANITAGHIVILSLVSLIFIFKTIWISPASIALVLFISVLELLVAALQAYIFTLLTALFIGMATDEHAHDHPAELNEI